MTPPTYCDEQAFKSIGKSNIHFSSISFHESWVWISNACVRSLGYWSPRPHDNRKHNKFPVPAVQSATLALPRAYHMIVWGQGWYSLQIKNNGVQTFYPILIPRNHCAVHRYLWKSSRVSCYECIILPMRDSVLFTQPVSFFCLVCRVCYRSVQTSVPTVVYSSISQLQFYSCGWLGSSICQRYAMPWSILMKS